MLTTRGRKTGRLRVTPVNYLAEGSVMYVLSGMGTRSDCFQNLRANPRVQAQVGNRRFGALAEPIVNPAERRRVLYLWLEHDSRASRPRTARAILRRIGSDQVTSIGRRLEEDPPPPIVALRPITGRPG